MLGLRVVRADVGATCVVVPSHQVIFIDPALGYEEAVVVIQATLPHAHPDAISHWVEQVMPTRSLTDTLILEFRDMPVRSHRRGKKPCGWICKHRLAMAAAVLVGVAGFGLVKSSATPAPAAWSSARQTSTTPPTPDSLFDPLAVSAPRVVPPVHDAADPKPTPSPSTTPFEDVVFERMEDHLKWRCSTVDGQAALMATCQTPLGLKLDVEKNLGPKLHTYVITYRVYRHSQRVTLKVFADDEAKSRLLTNAAANRSLFPNLVTGPNWAMYGSDGFHVTTWARGIGDKIDRPMSKTSGDGSGMLTMPTPSPSPISARR